MFSNKVPSINKMHTFVC